MISKSDATDARLGELFFHGTERNADGSPLRMRVNGKCKVWKTRPAEFRLPTKHGLYEYGYLTHENAVEWYISEDAALRGPIPFRDLE